ncbi:hypothetical protein CFC21_041083 [Triticum aestivum]|uniref:Phytocyanin domain-containing protein n=3 Tax=Triticum TaxID=4564 RepID=A0A3B6FP72_WHEAT|nr:early nodulin-like protein 1 [Triticum dicoccoides]XP_044348533.1 early nodulin-like protein 1 [Triticum aestivum]VAH76053.1 unnamed protein product [Triticum turgidum subsp. durum]KAF7029282.1 hypothetical protein CFC21_041078 [Triticum aestivum]KAF7029291.1 hypothetical protein CFC21_041083 [Triticum aestivum]CDM82817.1 unnamed protein product [Triticum aestivum]
MAALMIGSSSKPVLLLPALAFVLAFVAIPALTTPAQGLVFHVGGPRGWRVPDANTSYGWWAMNNRFHVGDELYFKYENDSVLLVSREEFDACNATDPLSRFADGSTTVRLDRPGFFCFISGEPGHCEEGQRLIVRVMVHPAEPAPAPAPAAYAPGQGGDGSGSGGGHGGSSPGTSSGAAAVAAGGVALAAAMAALCVGLVLLLQ